MRGSLPRLLGAAIIACLVAGLVLAALPDRLEVRTDIVGYPTFANFDITRHLQAYGLTVVVIPLVLTGAYLLLTRLLTGARTVRGPIPPPVEQVEQVPDAAGWCLAGVAAGRALLVALVLAFEISIGVGNGRLAFASTLVGYALLLSVTALIVARRSGRTLPEAVGAFNVLAASTVIGALYLVSRATRVEVSATGVDHHFPWLPLWLAAAAAAAYLVVVGAAWRRCSDAAARTALERRVMLLVVAPVGLFVLLASIPGSLGTFDVFEEGQVVVGSHLVRDGAFPWRDVLPAHGVLHDVVGGLVGTWVFEDSTWGVVAGQTMLLEPFAWIAVYYLCVFLFGSNWLYLLGTQALVVTGWMTVVGGPTGNISSARVRFLLLPLVLLLLVALLRRATPARAGVFMALPALQVIVTPEALAAAGRTSGRSSCRSLLPRPRLRSLDGFQESAVLHRRGARGRRCLGGVPGREPRARRLELQLDDADSGDELTGGIPRLVPNSDWFEMLAPVAVVLGAFAYVVIRTRLRRPLAFQDWAMVAMAAFSLVYYTKFLARADVFHLDHSYYVTIPLLFYVAYRGDHVRRDRSRPRRTQPGRHLVPAPPHAHDPRPRGATPERAAGAVRRGPGGAWAFAAAAGREPVSERIGFDVAGENHYAAIRNVSRAVDSLLGPGEAVFDFTNAPGLFHYLLEPRRQPPITTSAWRSDGARRPISSVDSRRPSPASSSSRATATLDLCRSGTRTRPGAPLRRQPVPPGRLRPRSWRGRLRVHDPAPGRRQGRPRAVLPCAALRLGIRAELLRPRARSHRSIPVARPPSGRVRVRTAMDRAPAGRRLGASVSVARGAHGRAAPRRGVRPLRPAPRETHLQARDRLPFTRSRQADDPGARRVV